MQQVAASNKDIAATGLFPGDPVSAEVSGNGAEFARVMEGNTTDSGDKGYRGHGDFFDSPDKATVETKEASTDESLDSEAIANQPNAAEQKNRSPEADSKASADKNAQPEADENIKPETAVNDDDAYDTDMHDEWVSIIQKLNGDDTKKSSGTAITSDADVGDALTEQDSTIPIDAGSDKESGELFEQQEEDTTAVTTELSWKEQLKEKLLNSGPQLNVHQQKALEKDLNAMTDEEIQQLLNNDNALRQMLSDIMKVQEPDPQDVALLLALAEQDDGLYNTVSITDLINQQGEGVDTEIDGIETDGNLENTGEHGDGTGESTPDVPVVETESENELPEDIFNDVSVTEVDVENTTGNKDEPLPGPIPDPETIPESASDPDTESVAAPVTETVVEDTVLGANSANNPNGSQQPAASTVSDEKPTKDQPVKLEQLLTQLDSSVKTDEQKVAALENLTRRVESSEIAQTPAGKTFIDSLKSATSEMKEQLKAGHEPAINLNKLVTDAVDTQSAKVDSIALENQVRGAVQQMVNVAQAHLSLEPSSRDNLISSFHASMNNRENAAAQVEASKTQQQNLQNQILDKAINIQKPEAAQELANKVQVMMNQKNMVADIRLDPPDLGQMQIKIALQGDSATVSMVVQSQAAREALEHNQPRLKELLEQQGIELGQSSVQQESQGNSKGDGDGSNLASGKGQEALDELGDEADQDMAVTMNEPEGIDFFA